MTDHNARQAGLTMENAVADAEAARLLAHEYSGKAASTSGRSPPRQTRRARRTRGICIRNACYMSPTHRWQSASIRGMSAASSASGNMGLSDY